MNILIIEELESKKILAEFSISENGIPMINIRAQQVREELEGQLYELFMHSDKLLFSEVHQLGDGSIETRTLVRKCKNNEERLMAIWSAIAGRGREIGGRTIRAYISEEKS